MHGWINAMRSAEDQELADGGLLFRRGGGVAEVTFNRPSQLNAMTEPSRRGTTSGIWPRSAMARRALCTTCSCVGCCNRSADSLK